MPQERKPRKEREGQRAAPKRPRDTADKYKHNGRLALARIQMALADPKELAQIQSLIIVLDARAQATNANENQRLIAQKALANLSNAAHFIDIAIRIAEAGGLDETPTPEGAPSAPQT